MITKGFKAKLGQCLAPANSYFGATPVISTSGVEFYITRSLGYPSGANNNFTLDAVEAGVSVGRSNAEDSEDYTNLLDPITSGITGAIVVEPGMDEDENPYTDLLVTVGNTSGLPITIGEIGYKQACSGTRMPGDTPSSAPTYTVLIDRTKLQQTVTLQPQESKTIRYRLKTTFKQPKTVSGIKMVSFAYGTDEEIFAIIDAARNGTIDLQTDAGWKVGNKRAIQVSGFIVDDKTIESHTAYVMISKFGDYNNCGSIMQIDFATTLPVAMRMNLTDTNVGSYDQSLMHTIILPAFYEALPSEWKQRMLTFSVVTGPDGNGGDNITTTGCKLALRSAEEIVGVNSYATNETHQENQIQAYKYPNGRVKYTPGFAGSAYIWLRSPYTMYSNRREFCMIVPSSLGHSTANSRSNGYNNVAPFFCI